ncbi:AAA domain protein [Vibrio phage 1.084.O._10N.261.49.F5]|nr:AAA domain protein [Vibrio phage 1.084.O._10N.261.49.F5]
MERDKGDFIGHFNCVANEFDNKDPCSSRDGLAIYLKQDSNDNDIYDGYCWSCHQSFFTEEINSSTLCSELGISEDGVVGERKFEPKPKAEPLSGDEVKKLYNEIGFPTKSYRKLKPEWMKYFGFLVKYDSKGVATQVMYPEAETMTSISGMKIRVLPKRFNKIGRTGMKSMLGGQIKYKSPTKRLLILAGENDGCAGWGMLHEYYQGVELRKLKKFNPNATSEDINVGDSVHVVWGTCGEGSLHKQLQLQYDFIDGYEEIILGLDNDSAGEEATKKCLKVLPEGKVKIAKWSYKDPHEMLERGKEGQFIRDFFNAKDFIDSGIVSAADAAKGVREFLTAQKITLPDYLHRLQDNMRGGIRSTGAIINIIGDTSIGKSFFTDNLMMHWFFHSPLTPTIISLERTGSELVTDFYSIYIEKNLTWFKNGEDAVEYLEREDIAKLCENVIYDEYGHVRFNIIEERNGCIEKLKQQAEYANKRYGSRLFVFDPLTDFLRSLGTEAQEDFMMWQKLKKKDGWVFINVLHTRKPPTDKDGNVRKVTEYDALGSGTFVQSSDMNIILNRNKNAECEIERNTTEVDLGKCRGGTTGKACDLYYDKETRQQYDHEDYFSGRKVNPDYKPEVLDDSNAVDFTSHKDVVENTDGVVECGF